MNDKDIMIYNKKEWKHRMLVGVATEGWIRFEWAAHRFGQIIPINWQCADYSISFNREPYITATAVGFNIDDAYNSIIKQAVEKDVEWIVFVEDDVLIPPDLMLRLAEYIDDGKVPIVSGLYYSKGVPSEPLIFRGRGNGCYTNWKRGDKVWCDGIPFGCLLVHMSIFRYMWDNSEGYMMPNGDRSRKVIQTPRRKFFDPELKSYITEIGTQDLYWCDRIIKEEVFSKTGWDTLANQKYPFLCDTNIFCEHIDRQTGRRFPTCLQR